MLLNLMMKMLNYDKRFSLFCFYDVLSPRPLIKNSVLFGSFLELNEDKLLKIFLCLYL